ncbi:hypothetical protein [Nocardioides sp. MH1]|uniref:hypothetical protein n=1 Tax=Nocardioides sp. MH1 TaxID=3242490 RepID=UPI003521F979
MLALAAFHRHLKVSTKQGESTVDGARWTSEDQLEIKLSNGDWVKADKVAEFSGEVEEPRSR